ncbi:MAG: hypothetical protein ACR2QW_01655 [bacterium]
MWKPLANRILLAMLVAMQAGCGEEVTPETLLRQTIDQVQDSAESRDLGDFMAHISEGYKDEGGRSWKDVRALTQLQFIRNPKIHTLKRITELRLTDDTNASATVLVALAGRPIDNASALSGLRAELMRFELELRLGDHWRIVNASWHRADLADFLQ